MTKSKSNYRGNRALWAQSGDLAPRPSSPSIHLSARWGGSPSDFTRMKQSTTNTEKAHSHRADKAIRKFSWEDGE